MYKFESRDKLLISKEMFSELKENLKEEPSISSYRIQGEILWEMVKNECASCVIRNGKIVGYCATYHYSGTTVREPAYAELGTLWVHKQYRKSTVVKELGNSLPLIAKGKKIMVFCKEIKLAKYFEKSPVFPTDKIANHKNCPRELIESSFPQFRGWLNDEFTNQEYERVLYQEDKDRITPWYLVYE